MRIRYPHCLVSGYGIFLQCQAFFRAANGSQALGAVKGARRPPIGLSMLGAKRRLFLCKWQQDCRIRPEDGVADHTKKENQNERVRMPAFARERDSPIAPRKRLVNITKKYQYPGEE